MRADDESEKLVPLLPGVEKAMVNKEVDENTMENIINLEDLGSNCLTIFGEQYNESKLTEPNEESETIEKEYTEEFDPNEGISSINADQLIFKWNNRRSTPELPSTVTLLNTDDGSKVYLVGTVHFSQESQEDVAQTIRETHPDIVMVELCNSRVNILSMDEKKILEESKNMNLQKIRLAIKQNGLVQGLMYLLLLSMSAHLTKELGMAPGGEFRRAFQEARNVPGCILHLGDRPIQITLQRALGALSLWQKIRLAWYIFTSKEPITKEEVERFKRSDLLEELLAEMTGEFPALSRVFVTERDYYLAYSLQLAATPIHTAHGIIPSVVVGVVGIGHVPGIVENWQNVTEKTIAEVMRIPKPSVGYRVFRNSLRIAMASAVVWGACRFLFPNSSLFSPRHTVNLVTKLLQR